MTFREQRGSQTIRRAMRPIDDGKMQGKGGSPTGPVLIQPVAEVDLTASMIAENPNVSYDLYCGDCNKAWKSTVYGLCPYCCGHPKHKMIFGEDGMRYVLRDELALEDQKFDRSQSRFLPFGEVCQVSKLGQGRASPLGEAGHLPRMDEANKRDDQRPASSDACATEAAVSCGGVSGVGNGTGFQDGCESLLEFSTTNSTRSQGIVCSFARVMGAGLEIVRRRASPAPMKTAEDRQEIVLLRGPGIPTMEGRRVLRKEGEDGIRIDEGQRGQQVMSQGSDMFYDAEDKQAVGMQGEIQSASFEEEKNMVLVKWGQFIQGHMMDGTDHKKEGRWLQVDADSTGKFFYLPESIFGRQVLWPTQSSNRFFVKGDEELMMASAGVAYRNSPDMSDVALLEKNLKEDSYIFPRAMI